MQKKRYDPQRDTKRSNKKEQQILDHELHELYEFRKNGDSTTGNTGTANRLHRFSSGKGCGASKSHQPLAGSAARVASVSSVVKMLLFLLFPVGPVIPVVNCFLWASAGNPQGRARPYRICFCFSFVWLRGPSWISNAFSFSVVSFFLCAFESLWLSLLGACRKSRQKFARSVIYNGNRVYRKSVQNRS